MSHDQQQKDRVAEIIEDIQRAGAAMIDQGRVEGEDWRDRSAPWFDLANDLEEIVGRVERMKARREREGKL